MKISFNNGWAFSELAIDANHELLSPDAFFDKADSLDYIPVTVPHDWQIHHIDDLYKNSTGFYKKTFNLSASEVSENYLALLFEGVYMNSAVWVNGQKAGEWKYGYSAFEFNISSLVHEGENEILVIVVYQNCNTRWYSGAGIIRDVFLINSPSLHLVTDGVYFSSKPVNENELTCDWSVKISAEIMTKDGKLLKEIPEGYSICHKLLTPQGSTFAEFSGNGNFSVSGPELWDLAKPFFYILTTQLLDSSRKITDEISLQCGFKHAKFTADQGFFLNGRHVKIKGACQHHDHGLLGAAFNLDALRRQFTKLREMGVNAIRCSHNPPPPAWLDLCDEMGLLVDNEIFDMWEKTKTPFDYGNYFNDWCERDVANWVRRDRNHPSLIMWSIGNEIYDTHIGNGLEITKRLSKYVRLHDPEKNAGITIASNYMMTDGAQKCAENLDTVGYNYLEHLYDPHHKKYPDWKIYGSETGSTIQSRGIYHFPESLKLVTFSDGQCSSLGNCTTPWGCADTQTVIANDRDCPFSAGQFIWTGWDYIGEPTPYHSKSSFFGQIDTAGFPKDSFYLFKSEWAGKAAAPFVHLLPYWDWNEGQLIDVKAYSNADFVELFFNGLSQGKRKINHKDGKRPFGQWQLEYHKGQIKALAYDTEGNIIAEDTKKSFEDPAQIILRPETEEECGKAKRLHFIQIMLADKNGTLVENARNYITFNVAGNAELLGMDNGDSTDYDEYTNQTGRSQTRKLFSNRLLAIVCSKSAGASFVITAASSGLPTVSLKFDGKEWKAAAPYLAIHAEKDFIPARKIELLTEGSSELNPSHKEVKVRARLLPENATIKEINWNPVFKECISSDNISLSINPAEDGHSEQSALIKAAGDGECILRCTARNGSKYDEVISDLHFSVSGIGSCRLNPYSLIEACRFTNYDDSNGKEKPEIALESGISNRKCHETWISFDKVDFGPEGADTIHLPVFSFASELPLQIWEGSGISDESNCLGKFVYRHESIYNTYSENVFVLSRRLFGLKTITISLQTDLYLHGFYFEKTPKAYAKLRALDANLITGDSFRKTKEAVEGIGNNVNLDFYDMDFGSDGGAVKLSIFGKSNNENNTINLKFFAEDGTSTCQQIEFPHTDDFEEKEFTLAPVTGLQKLSFVFLPGSNFDFKWFKFKK